MPECATQGCKNQCKQLHCVDCNKRAGVAPASSHMRQDTERNVSFSSRYPSSATALQKCQTEGCELMTKKKYCSDCTDEYQKKQLLELQNQDLQRCATEDCENFGAGRFCHECKKKYMASKTQCEDCGQLTFGRFCLDCKKNFNTKVECSKTCCTCGGPSKFAFCTACKDSFKLSKAAQEKQR